MTPTTMARFKPAGILLSCALIAAIAAYWTGLGGPFLLDDATNLEALRLWTQGQATLAQALSGGTGMYGRPMAMASLALSAWMGGYDPFAFKLGNLVVHLLCGLTIFLLLRRVAGRDLRLQTHAGTIAALVAALWLLHPLNASTVLYTVQRMAQMSALFVFLGLWLFMAARDRLELGASKLALAGLFVGVPLLTVAGFLSKENGILLPALCLVLELGCYARATRLPALRFFFGLFLLLPAIAGSLVFALKPSRVLGGYLIRDFDLGQRLLSQPRALCEYLRNILVPNPPRMGVYTDDFVASTGLLSPPTTLLAIVALVAISVLVWRLRHRIPALHVGWGLFLVGHALESSIVPLELYFEHRNYLPMAGVLYATVGVVFVAGGALRARGLRPWRIGAVAAVATLALLAAGTHGRARVWSDERLLAESAAAAHPQSMRAQLAVVDNAVRRGDYPRARQALDALVGSPKPRVRAQGHLNRINLDCATQHMADPAMLVAAVADAPTRVTSDEAETFGLLYANTRTPCAGIDDSTLALAAAAFADSAKSQPDWLRHKAELRYDAARFHVSAGDWAAALPQARLAWQPRMPAATSAILLQAQLAAGDIEGAERTLDQATRRARPEDAAGLAWLRAQIDSAAQRTPR